MNNKLCAKCKRMLSLESFTKLRKTKDGLDAWCRECKHQDYLKRPKELNQEYAKRSYRKHRERMLEKQKQKLANPPEKWLEWRRAYDRKRYKNNSAIYKTRSEMRKAAKLKAIPSWADKNAIKSIYAMARLLDKLNPWIKHHVDHIIPLRGDNVCGLHMPENLRIISATENLKKGNRMPNPTL